jgi:hypothetical protein
MFLILLMPLGLVGCSSSGTVSGKVSYKGTMLKGGTVTFVHPEGKASATTQIGEDGSYTIPKIPPGDVKICVDTSMLNPAGRTAPKYSPPPGQNSPYAPSDASDGGKRYVAIPPDYADPDKTTLTLTIKGGKQEHNIEMN